MFLKVRLVADMTNDINEVLSKLKKNKHFKYGLPFFGFVIAGFLILQQSRTVYYEFKVKPKTLDRAEIRALGIPMREKPETLEEAYEEIKKLDLDNWENIRGPRLWDETPSN